MKVLIRALILFLIIAPLFSNAGEFYDQHLLPTYERATDKTSVWIVGAGVLAALAASTTDDSMRAQWKDNQKISRDNSNVGDFLGTGIPSAMIALGQYYFDNENGKSHIRALVFGTTMNYALKYSFQKPRPGGSQDRLSMPSGHTFAGFATATSLTYAYGWKAAVVAYPVAAFVGLTRMSDDKHWFSDVIAGAFVGVWMGRAAYFTEEKTNKSNSMLFPTYTEGQWTMNFVSHF